MPTEPILPIRRTADSALTDAQNAPPSLKPEHSTPPGPTIEPLLVPAPEAARLCGISEATWFRLKSAGNTPPEVRLGGRVLYRVEDLRLWVSWGCGTRREFEARKAAAIGVSRK
jgi:predicted DNA-binding transcriptional regulator AlpA